jgi:glycerate 2-kinase
VAVHLLAAPDSFKSSLSAREVAGSIASAARSAGWTCDEAPLSDGGEGFVEALGAVPSSAVVHGPLGDPVDATWGWLPDGDAGRSTAVIEVASAAGLVLAGGIEHNDPVAATTRGVGELIAHAAAEGAKRILVGCGGSATTDGGAGALEAMQALDPRDMELLVAVDTNTRFLDAPRRFGPQKGADEAQIALLERRLAGFAVVLDREFGRDVTHLGGGGAAGGLAGGLAAWGGRIVPGFSLVAAHLDLERRLRRADLVVTGEGRLDRTSFTGKVVGSLIALARGCPLLVIVGQLQSDLPELVGALEAGLEIVDLSERYGPERALGEPTALIEAVVAERLGSPR